MMKNLILLEVPIREGVITDFGYDGDILRFEILHATSVVECTKEVRFSIGEELSQ